MYNKVILIGRLVNTPELNKTANDKSVARATLAVNRRYKGQNGEREADFVNVIIWGKLAETLASYATKGSLISLDGELRTRRYEKDGVTHYVTEVLCNGFQLLESRAQRALRENNTGADLADLVLEEEQFLSYLGGAGQHLQAYGQPLAAMGRPAARHREGEVQALGCGSRLDLP